MPPSVHTELMASETHLQHDQTLLKRNTHSAQIAPQGARESSTALYDAVLEKEVAAMQWMQAIGGKEFGIFMNVLGALCSGEGIVGINAALYWVLACHPHGISVPS